MVGIETDRYLSWGRYHRYRHRAVVPTSPERAIALLADPTARPILPFGRGRSYGDSCLNDGGTLLDTQRLDHFIAYDRAKGMLVCEAGSSFSQILELIAEPLDDGSHWFLPVSPGTRFLTIGGAIANDVHGKNHDRQGSFGRHVEWLDLARSDGKVLRCSRDENGEIFAATIGGLGLTGLVLRAAVQLVRVPSLMLEVEEIRVDTLDDYFQLRDESLGSWEYCAAWVDVLARGRSLGRGIYTRARHAPTGTAGEIAAKAGAASVPVDPPAWLLNRASLAAFNALYSRKLLGRRRVRSYRPYHEIFYPLDAIGRWNRLYGRPGFLQYQCVIPGMEERNGIVDLLGTIAADGQGSFLAVVKNFGPLESPGLLSFPMPGTTLALDFPNRGTRTLALLDRLDAIVIGGGGRVYPAKDGRMNASTLAQGFPALPRFAESIDPAFSSSFWRRTAPTVTRS
jgi:FAD/FMN-containing dehydrogenase